MSAGPASPAADLLSEHQPCICSSRRQFVLCCRRLHLKVMDHCLNSVASLLVCINRRRVSTALTLFTGASAQKWDINNIRARDEDRARVVPYHSCTWAHCSYFNAHHLQSLEGNHRLQPDTLACQLGTADMALQCRDDRGTS